eukprot:g30906.t1
MALEPVSLDNEIRSLQPGLSASEVDSTRGVSTTKARYWDQKARDHTFHPDRHGGRWYNTLEWPDELALQWAVFFMWRTEPALTDEQVVDFLRQQGWTWDPSRLKLKCVHKCLQGRNATYMEAELVIVLVLL